MFLAFVFSLIAAAHTFDVAIELDGAAASAWNANFPKILSWTPRALLYERFLSDDEIEHLKHLAPTLPGWRPRAAFNSVYFTFEMEYADPVLLKIEDRIAAVTGVRGV